MPMIAAVACCEGSSASAAAQRKKQVSAQCEKGNASIAKTTDQRQPHSAGATLAHIFFAATPCSRSTPARMSHARDGNYLHKPYRRVGISGSCAQRGMPCIALLIRTVTRQLRME
jgi:hypothetical protein